MAGLTVAPRAFNVLVCPPATNRIPSALVHRVGRRPRNCGNSRRRWCEVRPLTSRTNFAMPNCGSTSHNRWAWSGITSSSRMSEAVSLATSATMAFSRMVTIRAVFPPCLPEANAFAKLGLGDKVPIKGVAGFFFSRRDDLVVTHKRTGFVLGNQPLDHSRAHGDLYQSAVSIHRPMENAQFKFRDFYFTELRLHNCPCHRKMKRGNPLL